MLGALLLAATAASAEPKLAELKTFRDWIVGCDNGLLCQASAMMPEADTSITVTVRRGAEGSAEPEAWLRSLDQDPVDVTADGKRLNLHLTKNDDEAFVAAPGDVMRLLDALRSAKQVEAVGKDGKSVGDILVDGATAALLYMDDQQHRLGTVGALVRRGDKPNSTVLPPPELPVRYSVKGSAKPPAKLSPAFVAKVRKDNDCTDEKDPNLVDQERLDATHSFAAVTLLCISGAYNYLSDNYVIADGAAPRPAKFDDDNPKEDGGDLHYNLSWDAKTRRLDAGMKGRGIGDCGGREHYVWDGSQFRLVAVEEMGECRGVIDFISVWRAKVVER
jgi:hypothetical protein